MASPFALEAAKQDLQQKIEAAVTAHATGAPMELDISIDERATPEHGALSDAPEGLEADVRRLVDGFHAHEAVREADLRARHVTAFDSDGDGVGTVSVRFVYRQEAHSSDPSDRAADV